MSGVASVAELWGFSRAVGTLGAAAVLSVVVLFGTYRQVEAIGVAFGLCELVFVLTMFAFKPKPSEVVKGLVTFPVQDPEFSQLVASNIGAVIMPWMIYFQQSAVVARKLPTREPLNIERSSTLFGSFLTQMIMIGTLVTMAAARSSTSIKTLQAELSRMLAILRRSWSRRWATLPAKSWSPSALLADLCVEPLLSRLLLHGLSARLEVGRTSTHWTQASPKLQGFTLLFSQWSWLVSSSCSLV